MIWSWETIAKALDMAIAYSDARGSPYDIIVRARPDTVFLTPLSIDALVTRHRELDLLRPYFQHHAWNTTAEEAAAKSSLPVPFMQTTVTPLFFPSCCGYGGVTDR